MLSTASSDRHFDISFDGQVRSDQQLDTVLGNLLITGVAVSALVVLAGAIIYLVRHGAQQPNYRSFHREPDSFRTVSGILRSATEWSGRGFIQLGLLLLIATPVARVAFSLFAFLRKRDVLYSAFTLIVLSVLLFSLMSRHL